MDLTNAQWKKIRPFLPKPKASRKGGPKPIPNRKIFEGILWLLKVGARWKDIPTEKYASGSTCWRRLREWEDEGAWVRAWRAFLGMLDRRGQLEWSESFADGSFAPAKKGARSSEKPSVERAQSGWWWSTAKEFLLGTTWTRPVQRR